PGPAEPARGHREPDLGGAHALQRGRTRLQHAAPALSGEHRRLLPRLQGEAVLRGDPGERAAAEGGVLTRTRSARLCPAACASRPPPPAPPLRRSSRGVAAPALQLPPPPPRRITD